MAVNTKKPLAVFIPHGNLQYSQLAPSRRGWVVENCYRPLFELVREEASPIAFEASGFTLDEMARLSPATLALLRELVQERLVEPVGSPYTHMMLSNVDPDLGLSELTRGRDAWERLTGVRPAVGWNPECAWAHFIPRIYAEAGYESLVMDGDSFLLSFPAVRQATGLGFDVRGHSNKGKIFLLDDYIQDKPELLRYLTNPSRIGDELNLLFRTDMLANPMLWYLMGATEGVRERPVTRDELEALLGRWHARVQRTGSMVLTFAEDAEYIGSSAYFYVKQFGQARFFEPEPQSIIRFRELLNLARSTGFTLSTPSDALREAALLRDPPVMNIENGVAWHGGTAKAWANTHHARILDPVGTMVLAGIRAVARHSGQNLDSLHGPLAEALSLVGVSCCSDARWPPLPTSPGRFNVMEAIDALEAANQAVAMAMAGCGAGDLRALYSPDLMASQIACIRAELESFPYFEESLRAGRPAASARIELAPELAGR